MTTKPIKDYLVKQLFIEKNIVTYRSLSRKFGIHVAAAEKELAHYHARAHEDSQVSYASYILTGVSAAVPVAIAKRSSSKGQYNSKFSQQSRDTDASMVIDDGFGMSYTQDDEGAEEEEDEYEDDEDYEDVPVIKTTIVNEKDLPEAKAGYRRLFSAKIYCLSPSPIIDAGLYCTNNESIRATDHAKDAVYAKTVGKLAVPKVIVHKSAAQKEQDAKKAKSRPATAGASRLRTEIKKPAPPTKDVEMKDSKPAPPPAKATPAPEPEKATAAPKAKQTGKLNFQPKEKTTTPAPPKVDPKAALEEKKKGFFASKPKIKPAAAAPAPVKEEPKEETMEEKKEQEQPKRGTKRKSTAGALEVESDSDEAPPPSKPAPKDVRVKRGALISDDEDDEAESKPKVKSAAAKRKAEAAEKARLAEEKLAKEMMDIDDDAVERVSRKPSPKRKRVLSDDEDEDASNAPSEKETSPEPLAPKKKPRQKDEDVEMREEEEEEEHEDLMEKPKTRKKREKKVIPLGRNGLKKRKVTKTRMVKDAKGYMGKEEYSDWESVDEEVEEPKSKPKAKARATASAKGKVKEEPSDDKASSALVVDEDNSGPSRAPSRAGSTTVAGKEGAGGSKAGTPKSAPSKPAAKATKAKATTATANVKGKQQSIANFFGKPKAK